MSVNFQEILDNIVRSGGICFGSRAWGGYTSFSDYDFFMKQCDYDNIKEHLVNISTNYEENDYYDKGYYFEYKSNNPLFPLKINITICKYEDFEAWKIATNMMLSLNKEILNNKQYRHLLFESLLAMLTPLYQLTKKPIEPIKNLDITRK